MTPTDRNLMAGTASDNATPVQSAQAKPEQVEVWAVMIGGKIVAACEDRIFAISIAGKCPPNARVVRGVFVPKEG